MAPRSPKHDHQVAPDSSSAPEIDGNAQPSLPHAPTPTANLNPDIPSARPEEWLLSGSDEEEDTLPRGSPMSIAPKLESPDVDTIDEAAHSNQTRLSPEDLTQTQPQKTESSDKRKVVRTAKPRARGPFSLKERLVRARKSDSTALYRVNKALASSKEWANLTNMEKEAKKKAAKMQLMQERFDKGQSREYIEHLLEMEASDKAERAASPSPQPTEEDEDEEDDEEALKSRIELARATVKNYVFMAAFVKHAPDDVNLDFEAIGRELGVTKEAAVEKLREIREHLRNNS